GCYSPLWSISHGATWACGYGISPPALPSVSFSQEHRQGRKSTMPLPGSSIGLASRRKAMMPMTNTHPYSGTDLERIAAGNQTARRMIAGFSAEITRLTTELAATRLSTANLLAAARATLDAYADGEPDPLYYLRDELDARQTLPERHGRAS